jgi:hypothetical protein
MLHLPLYHLQEEWRREVPCSSGCADNSKAPLLGKVSSMPAKRFQQDCKLLNPGLESAQSLFGVNGHEIPLAISKLAQVKGSSAAGHGAG